MKQRASISVVMPCLNEEVTIGSCIEKIQSTFVSQGITGEIIVCDNGSSDRSVEIAESLGAKVVHQPLRGYGNAYIKGFASAQGEYLIMGDADNTYDFYQIPKFIEALVDQGYEFVTGSRFLEKTGAHHDPFLHRFFGNPAITAILNLLFRTHYTDVYCGFRGFSRTAYDRIAPVSPGMEFNLELAINAGLAKLRTKEIAIHLAPRQGESKLRTFRDGWRSLRMMLLYSPNGLFLIPGSILLTVGLLTHLVVLAGLVTYEGRSLGAVTGVFATILSVVGFEILSLGLHAKTYSWSRRFDRNNPSLKWFYKAFNLEIGLLIGTALILTGAVILIQSIIVWLQLNLSPLPHPAWITFAATLIIIGFGIVFSSLFISAMSMQRLEAYEQQK